ncbi:MAG: hypothetical protein IBX50_03490 [Marinospirillum sp.]|uniref:hypothetical protein n=1 Tax=Marinospirillum sp. TaxID=2183934 RepID=UPI001A010B31|nr:hypothetical protein [Marinospirillum sp.]MBE0505766.1 hypothetical protein [Marinospirillum sp.]
MSRKCYVATAGGFCMAGSSKSAPKEYLSHASQDAAKTQATKTAPTPITTTELKKTA